MFYNRIVIKQIKIAFNKIMIWNDYIMVKKTERFKLYIAISFEFFTIIIWEVQKNKNTFWHPYYILL